MEARMLVCEQLVLYGITKKRVRGDGRRIRESFYAPQVE